ncbi:hypothetical protein [Symbiopectobacterium sp. RP]
MITANALICVKKIQLIVIKIMSLGYSNGKTGLHPLVLPPVTQLRDTA